MANICDIKIQFSFANAEAAKIFEAKLYPILEQARKTRQAALFSNSRKYFEETFYVRNNAVIDLHGEITWVLDNEEAVKWVSYFTSLAPVESISIFYHVDGNKILGRYEYRQRKLFDINVPEEYCPEYDAAQKKYIPPHEETIDEHGVEIFVEEFSA